MEISAPLGYTLNGRIGGITQKIGKSAGIEANYAYSATSPNGDNCILMHCNPGVYTILDNEETLQKIHTYNEKTITWYMMKTGYIGAHVVVEGKQTNICLHQILMDHYGHGKGQVSVDHINGNKLDNRHANLRITDQSTQNQNRGKVSRHQNACTLPDVLKDVAFPKFVVYYKENVNSTQREFFTVEGHPIQRAKEGGVENAATLQLASRRWATTKSGKFTILQKYEQACKYAAELDILAANPEHILNAPVLTAPKVSKEAPVKEKPAREKKEKVPAIPKQWKVKQIYDALITSNYQPYVDWCASANSLTPEELDAPMTALIASVKGATEFKDAEPIIREFIENLRRLRHNKLSAKNNEAAHPIDRENRQQWPAATVLKLYKEHTMGLFKEWLDKEDDTADDPVANKRWVALCEQIGTAPTDKDKVAVISKFMTARRARKYRATTNNTP